MGIGVGANVVALLLVVPPLGALGAALAAVVGAGVASGLNLFFVQRFVGIPARSFLGIRRGDLGIVTSRARALLPRS
jgi:O-antigen/teichoic acid export membrane protein